LIFFAAGESALVNIRKTNLDRALELTVRELRTGQIPNASLSELRSRICDRMGDLPRCTTDLTIELNVVSTTTTNAPIPSLTATCVNRSTNIEPALNFNLGVANDMVLVRACYVIDYIFPTSVGSVTLTDTADDEHQLVSTTAFVNEPL
jgi:hypothetical protein